MIEQDSTLRSIDRDLIRERALDSGGVVGGDHEEVRGAALRKRDRRCDRVSNISTLRVVPARKSCMHPVADRVGGGITRCGVGVPS